MAKSKVVKPFSDLLKLIKDVAKSQGDNNLPNQYREWFIPPDFAGDLLDPKTLTAQVFERSELNADYLKLMQSGDDIGKVGDFMATKHQIDYTAASERAFRFRHCSVVRALAHSSARRKGLSVSNTINNIEKLVANVSKAATDVPQV